MTEEILTHLPKRKADSNKGTYGKILVAAGSKNMCGAAFLAGKAAYHTGSGLVRVLTEACNRICMQTPLPEAVLDTLETGEQEEAVHVTEKDLESADSAVRVGIIHLHWAWLWYEALEKGTAGCNAAGSRGAAGG